MPYPAAAARGKAASAAASNWWQAGGATGVLAAYKPKGAVSLAASYVNLANPGTDSAPGVAPTLAAGGWVFNGSTQYLVTGITPGQNYSFLVQFTGVTNTGVIAGSNGNSEAYFWIEPDDGSDHVDYVHGSAAGHLAPSPRLLAGNLGMSATKAYRNGVEETGSLSGWSGTPKEFFIGCRNDNNTPSNFTAVTIAALVIYDNSLSAGQMAAVAAAMAAL